MMSACLVQLPSIGSRPLSRNVPYARHNLFLLLTITLVFSTHIPRASCQGDVGVAFVPAAPSRTKADDGAAPDRTDPVERRRWGVAAAVQRIWGRFRGLSSIEREDGEVCPDGTNDGRPAETTAGPGSAAPTSLNDVLAEAYARHPPVPSIVFPGDAPPSHGILLMDAFCPYHGKYLEEMALRAYGAGVVRVLSEYITRYIWIRSEGAEEDHMSSRSPEGEEAAAAWAARIPFPLAGIVCESDSGLAAAERLGAELSLERHDGVNEARRNKYLTVEACAAAGLPTVRQRLVATADAAASFCAELGGRCVVKPWRGVASGDVSLCRSPEEARSAFDAVHGGAVFGSPSGERVAEVLVQEFAVGTEYAVDVVSRAGQHKAMAVWRYDKRPANGAPFVYHATVLDVSKEGGAAADHAGQALDALGVRWGLSHVEVMIGEDGEGGVVARLIEVNMRQHNTDFAPLVQACIGYNALDVLLAAYLGDLVTEYPPDTEHLRVDWDEVPDMPARVKRGAIVHLVSHAEGSVTEVVGMEEINEMESVLAAEIYSTFRAGGSATKTIDILSDAGWLHMMHEDEEQFQRDYDRVMELMPTMFITKPN